MVELLYFNSVEPCRACPALRGAAQKLSPLQGFIILFNFFYQTGALTGLERNYFEYFKPCDIRNNLHSNRYALRENPSLGACAAYLTKLLTQTYDYERTLQEVEFIISVTANAFIDSTGPGKSGVGYC